MTSHKVGILQMCSSPDPEENMSWIRQQFKNIDLSLYDFLFFPENSLSIKVSEENKIFSVTEESVYLQELIEICKFNNLQIQMSNPYKTNDGKPFNSSFWITPEGIKSVYNKIHLFKVQLPQKNIDENLSFLAGEHPVIHENKDLKIGSTICYDLRFSRLFHYYAESSVDIITVPSAFISRTGKDHWHTLLRARAIETQSFVIAAAQTGTHFCKKTNSQRKSYGHSLVINPWGNILLDAGVQPGFYSCYIDLKNKETAKKILPLDPVFKG